MTENQEKEMFKLLRRCVNGIQKLESDVAELKDGQKRLESDVAELKDGQKRIETKIDLNDRVINALTGEQYRIKERLLDLEQPQA